MTVALVGLVVLTFLDNVRLRLLLRRVGRKKKAVNVLSNGLHLPSPIDERWKVRKYETELFLGHVTISLARKIVYIDGISIDGGIGQKYAEAVIHEHLQRKALKSMEES